MGDETIFDAVQRTDPSPRRYAETGFPFLNRVEDPAFDRVRELIESWYRNYPSGEDDGTDRQDIRKRLRSANEKDHLAALWELYLHETFRRLGFVGDTHPETPTGKRPDFRFRSAAGDSLLLEATIFAAPGVSGSAKGRSNARVMDLINEVFHPDFGIKLDYVAAGNQTPSREQVVDQVEAWLGGLDWEEVRALPYEDRPTREFSARGSTFKCTAWPKGEHMRDDRTVRTIMIPPAQGGVSRMPKLALDGLRKKASRYGVPDEPYVIAAACLQWVADNDDFEQALYGPHVVHLTGPSHEAVLGRQPRGLWQRGRQVSATRVSAVLGTPAFGPSWIAKGWPRLWLNPWASHPLDLSAAPWPRTVGNLEADQLEERNELATPAAFFDLEPDWPGEPFAARPRRWTERRPALESTDQG